MKKSLTVIGTIYAHENTCVEDVVAIGNSLERKGPLTHKPLVIFESPTAGPLKMGHNLKGGFR